MPRIEEIETFNQELIKTGREPEVARTRGEEIEAVLSPEQYPMDHLGPLTRSNRPKPGAMEPKQETVSPANSPSVDDLFSSFIDSPDTDPAPENTGASSGGAFDDLFDDEILGSLPGSSPDDAIPEADPDIFDDLANLSSRTSQEPDEALGLENFNLDDPFKLPDMEDDTSDIDSFLDSFESQNRPEDELPEPSGADTPEDSETSEDLPLGDQAQEPASLDDFFSQDLSEDPIEDSFLPDPEAEVAALDDDPFADLGSSLEDELVTDSPNTEAESLGDLSTFDDLSTDPFAGLDSPDPVEEFSNDDLPAMDDPFAGLDSPDLADEVPVDEEPVEEKDPFDFSSDFDSLDVSLPSGPSTDTDDFASDFASDLDDFTASDSAEPEEALAEADASAFEEAMESPEADADDFGSSDPGAVPDFGTDLDADFGTDDFPEEFSMGDFEKEFGVMDSLPSDDWKTPAFTAPSGDETVEDAHKATAADEAKDWQISKDDLALMQQTLSDMPLNLKIATEETLGNAGKSFKELKQIIDALIAGESPTVLAGLVSKISGKKIKIPAGYTKRSGRSFEDEQNSAGYLFVTKVLPVIRTVVLAASGIFIVGWLFLSFVLTPILATMKYDEGIAAINAGEYELGNSKFTEAYAEWPDNNRFVQYAETFSSKQEFGRAWDKYKELLGDVNPKYLPDQLPDDIRDYYLKERLPELIKAADNKINIGARRGAEPFHRAGILSFARFATWQYTPEAGKFENKYAESVMYLQKLLHGKTPDLEAQVLQGDIYLAWAEYLDDPRQDSPRDKVLENTEFFTADPLLLIPAKQTDPRRKAEMEALNKRVGVILEGARLAYARSIALEGKTDFLTSKMLGYFMASGNQEHVNKILKEFLANKELKADPKIIADLAGIMIDRAQGSPWQLEDSHQLINQAIQAGSDYSGLYYQLARYYRFLRDNQAEEKILRNAVLAFKNEEKIAPLSRQSLQYYIDTLIRSGENSLSLEKPLQAQEFLDEARKRYEDAILSKKIPQRAPSFGRLYARLGDIQYYQTSDWKAAKKLYDLALINQYGRNPLQVSMNRPRLDEASTWKAYQEISYKRGFIYYQEANALKVDSDAKPRLLESAILEFLNAQGKVVSPNYNLELALANSLTSLGNYEAGISHYRNLYDELTRLRNGVTVLEPTMVQTHRELVDLTFTVSNNLGVALYKLYRNGGPQAQDHLSQAQYFLTQASTLGQNLDRDAETAVNSESRRISLLNMDRILSPFPTDDVFLLVPLYRDMDAGNLNNWKNYGAH